MKIDEIVTILNGVVHVLTVKSRDDAELKTLADAVQSVLQAILTDIVGPYGPTN